MERREFLIGGGTVLLTLPVGWAIAGGQTNTPLPASATTKSFLFMSSVTNGHSHQITLGMRDIGQPPEGGIAENTTTTEGHFHAVTLSVTELLMTSDNRIVNKNTSIVEGHMHTFQFSLASGMAVGGFDGGAAAGGTGAGGGAGTGASGGAAGTGASGGAAGTGASGGAAGTGAGAGHGGTVTPGGTGTGHPGGY